MRANYSQIQELLQQGADREESRIVMKYTLLVNLFLL